MKKEKILLVTLLTLLLSSCTLTRLDNLKDDKDYIIEDTTEYCEDYDACKVQVDSNVKVEDYKINNSYVEAYKKVNEVSVVVNGFNHKTETPEEYVLSGYHSGFIISKELVNPNIYSYTVLSTALDFENLPYYEIMLSDGNRYEANLKGIFNDAYIHLALFTFESNKNISLTNIVYDKDVIVGEELLAISSPSVTTNLMNSLTKGVVSGLYRQTQVKLDTYALGFQFDAPTNVGSEGGAIFDVNGNIYGMISGKISSSSSVYVESISIGNNLKDVKNIIDILASGKQYEKPLIGVSVIDFATVKMANMNNYYLYPLEAKVYNIEQVNEFQHLQRIDLPDDIYTGIYISEITSGSVAANHGMTAGDIILRIDNVEVNSNAHLAMYLYTLEKGTEVTIYTYLNPTGYRITL